RTIAAVDVQNVIDRFQHKAVSGAEALVRRDHGKLVAVVGKALVEKVEPVKAGDDLGIRLGSSVAGYLRPGARPWRDAAVHHRLAGYIPLQIDSKIIVAIVAVQSLVKFRVLDAWNASRRGCRLRGS